MTNERTLKDELDRDSYDVHNGDHVEAEANVDPPVYEDASSTHEERKEDGVDWQEIKRNAAGVGYELSVLANKGLLKAMEKLQAASKKK